VFFIGESLRKFKIWYQATRMGWAPSWGRNTKEEGLLWIEMHIPEIAAAKDSARGGYRVSTQAGISSRSRSEGNSNRKEAPRLSPRRHSVTLLPRSFTDAITAWASAAGPATVAARSVQVDCQTIPDVYWNAAEPGLL
jgi:hypothetical protein